MRLHRLKIETGRLETILTIGGDFIENLVKFNWGKLARTMFTLKHRRVELIEAEISAPGLEVAYLFKSRER